MIPIEQKSYKEKTFTEDFYLLNFPRQESEKDICVPRRTKTERNRNKGQSSGKRYMYTLTEILHLLVWRSNQSLMRLRLEILSQCLIRKSLPESLLHFHRLSESLFPFAPVHISRFPGVILFSQGANCASAFRIPN